LSEEKKQAIRQRVLEGTDIRAVATEFGIPPFRVGQLCSEEKATVLAKREEELDAYAAKSPAIEVDPSIDEPF
jgi:transposase-like protein